MAEDGDKKAKQVLKLTKNSSNFLSTIQIGVTLAGFLTSAVAAQNFAVMLTDALAKTSVVKVIPVGAISVISTILITLVMSYFHSFSASLRPKSSLCRSLKNLLCSHSDTSWLQQDNKAVCKASFCFHKPYSPYVRS